MNDLFADKAADWDTLPFPQQIARGVGPAVLARLPIAAEDVVLDFGAGTGLLTGHVAPLAARVVALDVSPAMLAQLQAKTELADRVVTRCQDILQQPLEERFSRVVSAMAMHHVEDTHALLAALYAHMLPGGRLALADLDTEDGDFHPPDAEGVFHHGFDRVRLASAMVDAGFTDVAFDTACTVVREAKGYPIFVATARKP
jgi:cyclopropane fatty-acyl-phospholipid synthase-like methyltransferase